MFRARVRIVRFGNSERCHFIPELFNSVVRITSAGELRGSGSIVYVPSETVPGKRRPYLVTAHHVIRGHEGIIEIDVPDPEIIGDIAKTTSAAGFSRCLTEVDLAVAPFPVESVPRHPSFTLRSLHCHVGVGSDSGARSYT